MTVLIQHGQGENAVYTKFHSYKPRYSRSFGYDRNDEVSEQHREQDDHIAFSYVAKQLKKMRIEARTLFGGLSRLEQNEIIFNKKKEIENILREIGSFLPDEIPYVIKRTSKRIKKIYAPYIKKPRKK